MTRILTCPKCGFKFAISYGRVMACGSCPSIAMGNCKYSKCPKCGFEFPI
ncbi:MAG: hypothetical protein ACTSSJ_01805 [Candidatus Odinarchaeia archaeon]